MEYIGEELATHSWTNLEDRMQFELDGVVEKEIKQETPGHIKNVIRNFFYRIV